MMHRPDDDFSELETLWLLPPEDSQRRRFESALPEASAAVQARWQALGQEDRLLREKLADAPVPENIVDRLLALPRPSAPVAARRSWKKVSVPWPVAAAVVLAVLGAGGFGYWETMRDHTMIVQLPAAPKEAVDKATVLAVTYHSAAEPLDVQGNDVKAVTTELRQKAGTRLGFDLAVPEVPTDFHLLGGSIVPFGGQLAVYTRWETAGKIYSLYQFPPKSVGMPAVFAKVSETSTPPAVKQPLRVTLWPGTSGACTWVSVSDPAIPEDPFCGQTY